MFDAISKYDAIIVASEENDFKNWRKTLTCFTFSAKKTIYTLQNPSCVITSGIKKHPEKRWGGGVEILSSL